MFCGGSLITNRGFRLGSTWAAKAREERMLAIANTLGRICGSRYVSFICSKSVLAPTRRGDRQPFTSSRRDGNIFRLLRLGEKRSKTFVKPFMNEIFSSLDFVENVARSKKLSVDIGREEKNECVGIEVGEGRFAGCRVISDLSKTCKSVSRFPISGGGRPALSRIAPRLP